MTAATRSTQREPVEGHVRPEEFRHRAACRSVDPEVFFPTAVAGPELEVQVSVAKTVCAGCPVRSECLAWALSALPDGIAGGMTEHERREERARRRGAGHRSQAPGGCRGGPGGDRGRAVGAGGGGGVPGQPSYGGSVGPGGPHEHEQVEGRTGGYRHALPGLPHRFPGRDTSGRARS